MDHKCADVYISQKHLIWAAADENHSIDWKLTLYIIFSSGSLHSKDKYRRGQVGVTFFPSF